MESPYSRLRAGPPRKRALAQMGAWLAIVNLALGLAMTPARAAGPDQRPLELVAFGDSLSAGYMLAPAEAFPAQLEKALRTRGHAVRVANAGVSGDTTSGGVARIDWAVPDTTDGVILELGANDALRGIDPATARANLERILTELGRRGIPVLIAGMQAPRNWGDDYARTFDAMYLELAGKHGALLYPFFLDGVVLDPALNLGDGMHPNAKGVARIVERILPSVEQLIKRAQVRAEARAKPQSAGRG